MNIYAPVTDLSMNLFGRVETRHWTRFQCVGTEGSCVVLLPHNVHLIRTSDLYALEIPIFVPAAPFIFQFIFPGSVNYCGHGEHPMRRLGLDAHAQRVLHSGLNLRRRGYGARVADFAPQSGELLPRPKCPYRDPVIPSCCVSPFCPWFAGGSKYDISEFAGQAALTCEEVLTAESAPGPLMRKFLRNSSTDICSQQREKDSFERLTPSNGDVHDQDQPAMDPIDHFYGSFDPWCNLEAYRYWYKHTDYFTLHGLQRFRGVSDLLHGLSKLLLSADAPMLRKEIVSQMRQHQETRVFETVHWWSVALTSVLRGVSAH